MADEALIRARVAGRNAADEVAGLYVAESARLANEHGSQGLEASIAFLERLRDNLLAIRPLPPVIVETPRPSPTSLQSTDYDEDDLPDGYVLVSFEDQVTAETDLAILIGDGDYWIPKSQLLDPPQKGDYVESLPVREWFAEKEGLI